MESAMHKSYTACFKLTVIERAEKIGNRAAAREYAVNERCVRRWRVEKEDLERMPKLKRAQRGGVVPWPDLEKDLETWIKGQQDKALPVSMIEIRTKAKLIAEQMGITDFKGGLNWCYRFMKRKKLSPSPKSAAKEKLQTDRCETEAQRLNFYTSSILKSYTAGFKLGVIERAEDIGNRAAAREYSVDERCVRRWRAEKEDLERMPKFKRAQRGGGVAWPDLEENLGTWVKEQQEKELPVSIVEIRAQAKLTAEKMGITGFTGGPNWCNRFMKRKKLSVDSKSTVQQKLHTDWCKKNSYFISSITNAIQKQKLNDSQVINMVLTSFSFICPLDGTVSSEEDEKMSIETTESEKISFACMLACAANGNKLKPYLIFKQKSIPKGNYPMDVIIRSTEMGRLCDKLILDWLNEIWRKRRGAIFEPRGILIVDSMLAQLLESIKPECEKVSATVATMPEEITPLNLTINTAFKREIQNHWEEWRRNRTHSFKDGDEIRKTFPEEISKWVSESWKTIKISTVISAFMEARIITSKNDKISEIRNNLKTQNEYNGYEEIVMEGDEILNTLFDSDNSNSDFDEFS